MGPKEPVKAKFEKLAKENFETSKPLDEEDLSTPRSIVSTGSTGSRASMASMGSTGDPFELVYKTEEDETKKRSIKEYIDNGYINDFNKTLENIRYIFGLNKRELLLYSQVDRGDGKNSYGRDIRASDILYGLRDKRKKELGDNFKKIEDSINRICDVIKVNRQLIGEFNKSIENYKKYSTGSDIDKERKIKISIRTIKDLIKKIEKKKLKQDRYSKEYSDKKAEEARLADEKERRVQEEKAMRAEEARQKAQEEEARRAEERRVQQQTRQKAEEEKKRKEAELAKQQAKAKKAAEVAAKLAQRTAEEEKRKREAAEEAAKLPELLTDFVVDILERIQPQTSTSFDPDGLLQVTSAIEEDTNIPDDNVSDLLHILPEVKEKTDEPFEFADLLQTISRVEEAVADFDSDFIIDILDRIEPQITQHLEIDGVLQIIPSIEEKTSAPIDNLPDILTTVASIEAESYEPFILDGIFSTLADVEEQRPDLETDFVIDILDRIEPQISQHIEIDGLLQIIPSIEDNISEPVNNLPDILSTIADIREQPAKPSEIEGLLEILPNIQEKQSEEFDFSELLQTISAVEEMVADFDSDFIVDILDRIEPQLAKPSGFEGLLETISAVEEKTRIPVNNIPNILETIADVEEEPNEPFLLDDVFTLLADIEDDKPTLESDFIIDILEKIEPQTAKPVDFEGILSVVGDIEEYDCESQLALYKLRNKQLMEEIERLRNGVVETKDASDESDVTGILEVTGNIGTSDKVSDESDSGGILEVVGNIGTSDKVSDESDFSGILDVLSSVSQDDDTKNLKACKVIEYVNANGEKETLYPFALINGRCYYYNKNRDILNDNLEIV